MDKKYLFTNALTNDDERAARPVATFADLMAGLHDARPDSPVVVDFGDGVPRRIVDVGVTMTDLDADFDHDAYARRKLDAMLKNAANPNGPPVPVEGPHPRGHSHEGSAVVLIVGDPTSDGL